MWKATLTFVAACLVPALGVIAQQPASAPVAQQPAPAGPELIDFVNAIIRGFDPPSSSDYRPWTPVAELSGPSPKDVDDESQGMESILDEISLVPVIASTAGREGRAVARARLWDVLLSPFAVVSAATARSIPGEPRLRMLITSVGVPTGEAFSVQFLNEGPPIQLGRGALVLQPLKKDAAARAAQAFGRGTGKATTVKMLGYCLQFRKAPPKAGMVYAVASKPMQQAYAPASDVFQAGRLLKDTKFLQPQGDPTAYYHSLRQWSWWTREQKFNQATFTDAFVDFTRKNVGAAGRPWTREIEAYVRRNAPQRWSDITKVLLVADKVAELRKRQ
jgi:hypothetical protein